MLKKDMEKEFRNMVEKALIREGLMNEPEITKDYIINVVNRNTEYYLKKKTEEDIILEEDLEVNNIEKIEEEKVEKCGKPKYISELPGDLRTNDVDTLERRVSAIDDEIANVHEEIKKQKKDLKKQEKELSSLESRVEFRENFMDKGYYQHHKDIYDNHIKEHKEALKELKNLCPEILNDWENIGFKAEGDTSFILDTPYTKFNTLQDYQYLVDREMGKLMKILPRDKTPVLDEFGDIDYDFAHYNTLRSAIDKYRNFEDIPNDAKKNIDNLFSKVDNLKDVILKKHPNLIDWGDGTIRMGHYNSYVGEKPEMSTSDLEWAYNNRLDNIKKEDEKYIKERDDFKKVVQQSRKDLDNNIQKEIDLKNEKKETKKKLRQAKKNQ